MATDNLTGKQRAALRGAANGITAVFQIGKGGIEETVIAATADCIAKRELIKIKLLETCPIDAHMAATQLSEAMDADVVQVIGRTIVLFKAKEKESAYADLVCANMKRK